MFCAPQCTGFAFDESGPAKPAGTREAQPVDVMKLTTLQRYMFNLNASDASSSTLPLGCDVETLTKFCDKPNIHFARIDKWLKWQGHEQNNGLPA